MQGMTRNSAGSTAMAITSGLAALARRNQAPAAAMNPRSSGLGPGATGTSSPAGAPTRGQASCHAAALVRSAAASCRGAGRADRSPPGMLPLAWPPRGWNVRVWHCHLHD